MKQCKQQIIYVPKKYQKGFTYLGLMVLLVIIMIVATTSIQLGKIEQQRLAEEELLHIGREFQLALLSYANSTPVGQNQRPKTLQELVKDSRFPNTQRHLRKIYHDPITGKAEWGIMLSSDQQRIIGIFSLSDKKPIKIRNFDSYFLGFDEKNSYQDWVFVGFK